MCVFFLLVVRDEAKLMEFEGRDLLRLPVEAPQSQFAERIDPS